MAIGGNMEINSLSRKTRQALLIKKKWTGYKRQMDVANESGVSQSMISKIRNGVLTDPPADVCIKILNAYGYSITLNRPKKKRRKK